MLSVTETSSFFVQNQALFGAYPTQDQIAQLENWGVDFIVNLTSNDEKKIKPYYSNNSKIIRYFIPDRQVPDDLISFCSLVLFLSEQIKNKKKIYIHCKGGHGRASLLVCAILCFINRISLEKALEITSMFHSLRIVHSSKPKKNEYWKKKGFPQFCEQKLFLKTIFQAYKIPKTSPFEIKNIWMNKNFDNYLLETYLGSIEGTNSQLLEDYRNNLIKKYFQPNCLS
jgi:hypothetical protein